MQLAHVLVVDDEPDMQEYLERVLRLAGYSVEAVPNGLQALACIDARRPDVVVSDLRMPELDGFGLLAALRRRADTRALPFILLTASDDRGLEVAGLDGGAHDFVQKPVEPTELLARVRVQIRLAADLAAARAEAVRDELTGLYNRRGLLDVLRRELAHARRSQAGLSILYIDLDGFKAINDSLGHAQGDLLLCTVGRVLGAELRAGDAVGRLGGDEFGVLLPGASAASARVIASRLAQSIADVTTRECGGAVGASIGVAHVSSSSRCGIEELLERADRAMYSAKRLHRLVGPSGPSKRPTPDGAPSER